MNLPDRFDYEGTSDGEDDPTYWPLVSCLVDGCPWSYHASWSDLANDGEVNWDQLHPSHSAGSRG